jgi:hypothetical protein
MSLFSSLGQLASSTIGSSLGGVVSAGIGSVTQAAQAGLAAAGQIFSDANPSVTQKKAEAIGQLGSSGQLPSFKKVSDVTIETSDDQTNTPSGFNQVRLDPFGKPIVRVQSQARTMPTMGSTESDNKTLDFMVSLRAQTASVDSATGAVAVRAQVLFTVSPTISERRSADYDQLQLLHHPGQILKYKWTNTRSWTINGRLVSRNGEEAERNLTYLNYIRSWVMPFTGEGTAAAKETKAWLGAPPPVLVLSAYGEKMVGPVPVVLKDYSWEFPNEVDYIETSVTKVPFPTIITVALNVDEAYSPAEYSGFDWIKYLEGNLDGSAFRAVSAAQVRKNKTTAAETPVSATADSGLSELSSVDDLIKNASADYNRFTDSISSAPTALASWVDGAISGG